MYIQPYAFAYIYIYIAFFISYISKPQTSIVVIFVKRAFAQSDSRKQQQ